MVCCSAMVEFRILYQKNLLEDCWSLVSTDYSRCRSKLRRERWQDVSIFKWYGVHSPESMELVYTRWFSHVTWRLSSFMEQSTLGRCSRSSSASCPWGQWWNVAEEISLYSAIGWNLGSHVGLRRQNKKLLRWCLISYCKFSVWFAAVMHYRQYKNIH